MKLKTILILTLLSFFISLAGFAKDKKSNDQTNNSFILKVTSKQPEAFEGSYLAVIGKNSKIIQIHQQTPFEIKIPAKFINAMFRTDANSDITVTLVRAVNNTYQPLLKGSGHTVVASSTYPKDTIRFIYAP